jgi:hypothetical protein
LKKKLRIKKEELNKEMEEEHKCIGLCCDDLVSITERDDA